MIAQPPLQAHISVPESRGSKGTKFDNLSSKPVPISPQVLTLWVQSWILLRVEPVLRQMGRLPDRCITAHMCEYAERE